MIITFGFNFFLSLLESSGGGKIQLAKTCGSSHLSNFGCIASQFDTTAIMSLVMSKGKLEQIAFSLSRFKLLR